MGLVVCWSECGVGVSDWCVELVPVDGGAVVFGLVLFLSGFPFGCWLWLLVFVPDQAGGVGVVGFHAAVPFAGASHVAPG